MAPKDSPLGTLRANSAATGPAASQVAEPLGAGISYQRH
jgi:hypothetical protein